MRIAIQPQLGMKSNYWSFDPEFNNFGNQNFNRFIDSRRIQQSSVLLQHRLGY
jgi:type IV secretory pathway VirB4 component